MVDDRAIVRQQLGHKFAGLRLRQCVVRLVEVASCPGDGRDATPLWRACCQDEMGQDLADCPSLAQRLTFSPVLFEVLEGGEKRSPGADRGRPPRPARLSCPRSSSTLPSTSIRLRFASCFPRICCTEIPTGCGEPSTVCSRSEQCSRCGSPDPESRSRMPFTAGDRVGGYRTPRIRPAATRLADV